MEGGEEVHAAKLGEAGTSSCHNISVTVRFRPLSERESECGEREIWSVVADQTVGVVAGLGLRARYGSDYVFEGSATNAEVYNTTAREIVNATLDGVNGTIFAYGVTSSGKTHTMTGTPDDQGVVGRAVADVFAAAERTRDRDFLLRLSMMEIHNEVVNDLLDDTRTNLRMREDPTRGGRGFYAEGLTEVTLVGAEHALSCIAAGDAQRKTSATALNKASSRSHTILRLSIESSARAADVAPGGAPPVARTLSALHLIDLAGSESARAVVTRSHTKEGSYINRSLLALGSVIAKLSDGHAAHVPFRNSKLTRVLASSLTGSGARIAVVCTVTPGSSQAEETHNTLKFAMRAKKVAVRAERNEVLDQHSLIARYQREVAALRAHLYLERAGGAASGVHDPMHPEVRNLRERLEEERIAVRRTISVGSAEASPCDDELVALRERVACMAEELNAAREAAASTQQGPAALKAPAESEDTEIQQIWAAERDFLNSQLQSTNERHAQAADIIALLRSQLLQAGLEPATRGGGAVAAAAPGLMRSASGGSVDFAALSADAALLAEDLMASETCPGEGAGGDREQPSAEDNAAAKAGQEELRALRGEHAALRDLHAALRTEHEALVEERGRLLAHSMELERAVQAALADARSECASAQQYREEAAEARAADAESGAQRAELARLEASCSQLQGFELGTLDHAELMALIELQTQAVERTRISVQLRRLATATPGVRTAGGGAEAEDAAAAEAAAQTGQPGDAKADAPAQAPGTPGSLVLAEATSPPVGGPGSEATALSPREAARLERVSALRRSWRQLQPDAPGPVRMPAQGLDAYALNVEDAQPVQWP
ncbi:hypothetical protein WJX81_008630 [Elliptochloris bilobata]|uniref:Kinesin motor domain-containing protein n=1 Tax=Elliptochloris bilobata TaxID=381761 RepID=A0AAW1SKG6_9CHLO